MYLISVNVGTFHLDGNMTKGKTYTIASTKSARELSDVIFSELPKIGVSFSSDYRKDVVHFGVDDLTINEAQILKLTELSFPIKLIPEDRRATHDFLISVFVWCLLKACPQLDMLVISNDADSISSYVPPMFLGFRREAEIKERKRREQALRDKNAKVRHTAEETVNPFGGMYIVDNAATRVPTRRGRQIFNPEVMQQAAGTLEDNLWQQAGWQVFDDGFVRRDETARVDPPVPAPDNEPVDELYLEALAEMEEEETEDEDEGF